MVKKIKIKWELVVKMEKVVKYSVYRNILILMVAVIAISLLLAGCTNKSKITNSKDTSNLDKVNVATDKTKNSAAQNIDTLSHLVPDGTYEGQESYRYHKYKRNN